MFIKLDRAPDPCRLFIFSDWEKITTIHNIIGTDISNLGIFRNGYSIHYDFLFNAIVIHKL